MDCPNKFYKRALQYFLQRICNDAGEKADHLELREEFELEKFILECKKTMASNEFYFAAGQVWEEIAQESCREGCSSLTACLRGLDDFKQLIGLDDE